MASADKTHLADRNNNPLNIKDTDIQWHGAVGSNAGFETFSNPELGVRAGAKNLYTSQETHGNSTLAEIITRHAPPEDYNDTLAYIDKVSADTGIGANDTLPNLKDNPELTEKIITSMADMEGASTYKKYERDAKYTEDVIANGVAMANGKPESEVQLATQDTDFDPSDGDNPNVYSDSSSNATNAAGGLTIFDNPNVYSDSSSNATVKEVNKTKSAAKPVVENITTPNWLSTIDSPAYRWSLYLVNNEIWNDPLKIGNDDAALNKEEAFIIAKQGVTTEFSIDNFMTTSIVTPGAQHGNTTPGLIQFDLFETLGFTFIDKVLTGAQTFGKPGNLYSQNYILKLEFLGRHPNSGASVPYPGVFLYPVKLNQIRSTTGPEGTRYNIIAWSALKHAQTEGVLATDISIEDIVTVKDFTDGLVQKYNKTQKDLIPTKDLNPNSIPPKQIKVVFDTSTNSSINPELAYEGAPRIQEFNLATNHFGNVVNANTAGQSCGIWDPDTRTCTLERETALNVAVEKTIENNCLAWQAWQIAMTEHGFTPHIVVDINYTYPPGTKGPPGTKLDEEFLNNVESILLTYTIKIALNRSTYHHSIKKGNENLLNKAFQAERIKTLPIEKSYTYMYSGLNTEVLNYQIDISNLYVVVDHPAGGQYIDARLVDGEPQFAPSEYSTRYLSDIRLGSGDIGYFNPVVGTTKPDQASTAQLDETSVDNQAALAGRISTMAKRMIDAIGFVLEIKGDPYWMGNMQAVIQGKLETMDYSKRDAYISFIQYNPNPDDLLETQIKGPLDVIGSGVYKLQTIESKFTGGNFTQTLNGYKDVNTNTNLVIQKLVELSGV